MTSRRLAILAVHYGLFVALTVWIGVMSLVSARIDRVPEVATTVPELLNEGTTVAVPPPALRFPLNFRVVMRV